LPSIKFGEQKRFRRGNQTAEIRRFTGLMNGREEEQEMREPAAPQKTVLETILDWSMGRPLWQRDALRRIIANGRLTDVDIGELVDLCKQGKAAPVGALKTVPLEKAHLPANPGQIAAVSLLSIADVTGVNNLAAGQTVEAAKA
jgi:hypothetical protein